MLTSQPNSSKTPSTRRFKFTPNGAIKTALAVILLWLGTDQHFQPYTGDVFTLWIIVGLIATSIDPPKITAPRWCKIGYEILSYLALNVGAARNALALTEKSRGIKLLPSPEKIQENIMDDTTQTTMNTQNQAQTTSLEQVVATKGIEVLTNSLGGNVSSENKVITDIQPGINWAEQYAGNHFHIDVRSGLGIIGGLLMIAGFVVNFIRNTRSLKEQADKKTSPTMQHTPTGDASAPGFKK